MAESMKRKLPDSDSSGEDDRAHSRRRMMGAADAGIDAASGGNSGSAEDENDRRRAFYAAFYADVVHWCNRFIAAIRRGDVKCMEDMLKRPAARINGIPRDACADDGCSCAYDSCGCSCLACKIKNVNDSTVCVAAQNNDPGPLQLLIRNGAKPDGFSKNDGDPWELRSPVHHALDAGCVRNAQLLLEAGANRRARGYYNGQSMSVLETAVRHQQWAFVDTLLDMGVLEDAFQAILCACWGKDILPEAAAAADPGAVPGAADDAAAAAAAAAAGVDKDSGVCRVAWALRRFPVLMLYEEEQRDGILSVLFSFGVFVDKPDRAPIGTLEGNSRRVAAIAALLVRLGARVDYMAFGGVIMGGFVRALEVLLSADSTRRVFNSLLADGTALRMATVLALSFTSEMRTVRMVQRLLEAGATAGNDDCRREILGAVLERGWIVLARLLLEGGHVAADATAFVSAARSGSPACIELLLEAGLVPCDSALTTVLNFNPQQTADGALECARILLRAAPAIINALDDSGESALSLAVQHNWPDVVRFLTEEAGADIELLSEDVHVGELVRPVIARAREAAEQEREAVRAGLGTKGAPPPPPM